MAGVRYLDKKIFEKTYYFYWENKAIELCEIVWNKK